MATDDELSFEYDSLVQILSDEYFQPIENRKALFNDEYQTKEQRDRDELITELLSAYLVRFKKKNAETAKDRGTLKAISIGSIITIIVVIVFVVLYTVIKQPTESYEYVVAVISSLVALCGSFFGIVKYIVARAFPTDEEKYITDIVKLIQENDLKHKQENIKVAEMRYEQEKNKGTTSNIEKKKKRFFKKKK